MFLHRSSCSKNYVFTFPNFLFFMWKMSINGSSNGIMTSDSLMNKKKIKWSFKHNINTVCHFTIKPWIMWWYTAYKEKDTIGIRSYRILGSDSTIYFLSLHHRAPSIYRPLIYAPFCYKRKVILSLVVVLYWHTINSFIMMKYFGFLIFLI